MCGVWAETEAERHSQAKDNALCVCMCVRAHVVGVCVWGLGVHGLFVGGGNRVRMPRLMTSSQYPQPASYSLVSQTVKTLPAMSDALFA